MSTTSTHIYLTAAVIVLAATCLLVGCNPINTQHYLSQDDIRIAQDGTTKNVFVAELNAMCNPGYHPDLGANLGHITIYCVLDKPWPVEKSQPDQAGKQGEAKP